MRTRFNPKAIEQMNEFDRYIKDKEKIKKIIKIEKIKKVRDKLISGIKFKNLCS